MPRRFAVCVLVFATILPVIFLFLAIQHGALTVPFWDHVEQTFLIEKAREGELVAADLWASHNHSRPMMFRVVILLNALLTDWDLRSEYVYLMFAIFGALGVLLVALRALLRSTSDGPLCATRFWGLAAIVSILACSPVGHNNHWWSMMLQLDLANLFIVVAFTAIGLGPRRVAHNWIAALACWLATYTLTNGLVAFVICAATAQLMGPRPLRPGRVTVFWTLHILGVLACYLPGLRESSSEVRPTAWAVGQFALAYLGVPLRGLLDFPYATMFELPREVGLNVVCGVAVLVAAAAVVMARRAEVQKRGPACALGFAFGCYAVGSALLTGWGRAAFDEYGVANANGSRYSVFGAYALFGILWITAGARPASARVRRALCLAGVVFYVVAAINYGRSWRVYHDAHNFDASLRRHYELDGLLDSPSIYPSAEIAGRARATMRRLRIGPYRDLPDAATAELITWLRGQQADQFGICGLRTEAGHGVVLFAHPASRFARRLDQTIRAVHLRFGILDGARTMSPPTDGVEFRLTIRRADGSRTAVWQRRLDPTNQPDDRGTQSASVELDAAADDVLELETEAGATFDADWAFWESIELVPRS